jgi:hypothetical protein
MFKKIVASLLFVCIIASLSVSTVFATESLEDNAVNNLEMPELTEELEPPVLEAATERGVEEYIAIEFAGVEQHEAVAKENTQMTNSNDEASFVIPLNINDNPNNAFFIPESFYGFYIGDTADASERWYMIQTTATRKISVFLEQPNTSSDYDVHLFRLDGNILNLVSFSQNGMGASEHLSYVGNAGIYFIRFVPFVPANPASTFVFRVDVLSQFDAAEPDDFWFFANHHTAPFQTNQTIDNPHDVDWISFQVNTAGTFSIRLGNVPAGAQYAVFLFNNNLQSIGSFMSSGFAFRSVTLPAGTYFAQIRSLNGSFNANHSYQFRILNQASIQEARFSYNGQDFFERIGTEIFWNGNRLFALESRNPELNWTAEFFLNVGGGRFYSRTQVVSDIYLGANPSMLNNIEGPFLYSTYTPVLNIPASSPRKVLFIRIIFPDIGGPFGPLYSHLVGGITPSLFGGQRNTDVFGLTGPRRMTNGDRLVMLEDGIRGDYRHIVFDIEAGKVIDFISEINYYYCTWHDATAWPTYNPY